MASSLSSRFSAAADSGDAAATRTVTELDHVRISNLAQRQRGPSNLEDVIDAADLVPSREVDADVVTMNSRVVIADAQGASVGGGGGGGGGEGERRTLTLCYPERADAAAGFVSVLSPIGAALLGLRVGDTARWTTPDGRTESARVLEIAFQPEASGDYTA